MTLREDYVKHLEYIARDYHDNFNHNKNTKRPDDATWQTCPTPRCEGFRRLMAEFPGTLIDEASAYNFNTAATVEAARANLLQEVAGCPQSEANTLAWLNGEPVEACSSCALSLNRFEAAVRADERARAPMAPLL